VYDRDQRPPKQSHAKNDGFHDIGCTRQFCNGLTEWCSRKTRGTVWPPCQSALSALHFYQIRMRRLAVTFVVAVAVLTALPANADQQMYLTVIKTAVTATYQPFELQDVAECTFESLGIHNDLPDPVRMCDLEGWEIDEEVVAAIQPETFRGTFRGVAVAVRTDRGRIFVLGCEERWNWWEGRRSCRVPVGPTVRASFKPRWFVELEWMDNGKRTTETYWIGNVLDDVQAFREQLRARIPKPGLLASTP
jgi:hypothetical protein